VGFVGTREVRPPLTPIINIKKVLLKSDNIKAHNILIMLL
jgi:hypothetical protein